MSQGSLELGPELVSSTSDSVEKAAPPVKHSPEDTIDKYACIYGEKLFDLFQAYNDYNAQVRRVYNFMERIEHLKLSLSEVTGSELDNVRIELVETKRVLAKELVVAKEAAIELIRLASKNHPIPARIRVKCTGAFNMLMNPTGPTTEAWASYTGIGE
ncbi:hypothetical protein ACLMJK_006314 [Lecanora helva]